MKVRVRTFYVAFGILLFIVSCSNPLLDKVTNAVAVATGPQLTLAAGATTILSGGTRDFGSVYIGSTSITTFTVKNIGKADLTLSGGAASVVVSETNMDQFSLSIPPNASTIPVGQSATFALSFSPTSVGAKTATVTVTSNDPSAAAFSFKVTGTGAYSGTVSTPMFNPGGGSVPPGQAVSILCLTAGATIYYTTDGSDPTTASAQVFNLVSPIVLTVSTTIRAMAIKAGMANSAVAMAIYIVSSNAPSIPVNLSAVGGINQVMVTWGASTGSPSYYNLYWAQGANDPRASGIKVQVPSGLTATITGLADGTEYAFCVTAVGSGETPESIVATAYTAVAMPQPSVGSGSYVSAQSVTIGSTTSGATIHYTTDGSTPSETVGTVYSSAVNISSNLTLKAIAFKSGFPDSAIVSATYTFTPPSAPTSVSATGGAQQVIVTWGAVTGAVSYNVYCKQGLTVGTTVYDTKILTAGLSQTVSGLANATQYAFIVTAVGCGGESVPSSPVATATTYSQVATPGFSPGGGSYVPSQSVTINCITGGVTIRYTTDGSTPSETVGTVYSSAVNVSVNPTTLKAIAYKSGMADSAIAPTTYNFTPPGAPTSVSATGGAQQVTVTWGAVAGAVSYNLYRKQGSTVSTISYDTEVSTAGLSQTVSGLANATPYAFIVTAVGCGGEGAPSSPIVTANTYPQVVTPTFSPAAGTYTATQSVTISTTTPGASLRYTTDGSTPTSAFGTIYSGPVSVSSTNQTFKAIAYKSGWTDSTVATAAYILQIATPTFSPSAGAYTSAQNVTIGTTTPGASIRYATNGRIPTSTSGTVYSGPVSVPMNVTLNAIAYESGWTDSFVAAGAYAIEGAIVTTLAGTAGNAGSANGTGSAAQFNTPVGVATDGTNLYVTDFSNCTIRKIVISTGAVTTLAGSPGLSGSADGTGGAARFSYPMGIAVSGSNLYVADTQNYTIRKIVISTGAVTTLAGSPGLSGSADGTGGAARFSYPMGITTDGTNLYITDSNNWAIRKIVISSGVVTTLASGLYSLDGIAFSGSNLYVVDGCAIRKIVISSATVTTLAGGPTVGNIDGTGNAAEFDAPQGIATDGTNLFVTDGNTETIRKIVISSALVTTMAGSAYAYGSSDGTGYAATFWGPFGVASDGTNLYVADSNNCTIRKVH